MKESSAALRAYADYQAQTPPRSLERLAQMYRSGTEGAPPTRKLRTLKEWSTQHRWQDRIAAYERQLIEERDAQEAEERKRKRKQRIQTALAFRGKGVETLATIRPGSMAPVDLARLAAAAVRLVDYADNTERRDMGEPDQRVEVGGPDGTELTFTLKFDRAGRDDD